MAPVGGVLAHGAARTSTIAATPVISTPGARLTFVARDDDQFVFLTDHQAPRRRLIRLAAGASPSAWQTLLPQAPSLDSGAGATAVGGSAASEETLEEVVRVGEGYAARWWLADRRVLRLHDRHGRHAVDLPLPDIGSVTSLGAGSGGELFFQFSSYTTPTGIYAYDTLRGTRHLLRSAVVPFTSAAYTTSALTLRASDDAAMSLLIAAPRGALRRRDLPLLLYVNGYRGAYATPAFSFTIAGWLQAGGRFAAVTLHEDVDYGLASARGGRSRDLAHGVRDLTTVLEALAREGYAEPVRLALHGGSDRGGLLVATTLLRRPALAAATWSSSGPMDLLALAPKTTTAAAPAWARAYGDPATVDGLATWRRLSPLENIGADGRSPLHLLTVGEGGLPAWHAYKFVAALQAASGGQRRAFLREEALGSDPRAAMLDERADIYAFFARALGMTVDAAAGSRML